MSSRVDLMPTCAVHQIWGYNGSGAIWLPMLELVGHTDRLHDVAWAPNIGRSYHLIATAGKDGVVGLWKVRGLLAQRTGNEMKKGTFLT
jgi:WD40 repeat protein